MKICHQYVIHSRNHPMSFSITTIAAGTAIYIYFLALLGPALR